MLIEITLAVMIAKALDLTDRPNLEMSALKTLLNK